MTQIVIGLSGKQGAGKSLSARYLQRRYGAVVYRMSDMVRQALTDTGLAVTPENYASTAELLFQTFGKNVLARRIAWRIQSDKHRLVVIDGFRLPEEETCFKEEFPEFTHVHLFADLRVRYMRLIDRGEKPWETDLAFSDFLEREFLSTELAIDSLSGRTNLLVYNNTSFKKLATALDRVMAQIFFERETTQ